MEAPQLETKITYTCVAWYHHILLGDANLPSAKVRMAIQNSSWDCGFFNGR